MKNLSATITSGVPRYIGLPLKLISALLFTCFTLNAAAQSVIAPAQTTQGSTPGQTGTFPESRMTNQQAVSALTSRPSTTPITWGPVTLHPAVSYRYTKTTGILSQPGQPSDTDIHFVVATLTTTIGNHWIVEYSPSYSFYSSKDFKSSVDHRADLIGKTTYESWDLGFDQGYSHSSQPMVETAQQVQEDVYSTMFTAVYRLDPRLLLETQLSQNLRYAVDSNDIKEWSVLEWFRLPLTEQFEAAFGLGYSYTEIYQGPDMTDYQAMARITWHTGRKLDLEVSAGFDRQKFNSNNSKTTTNPRYDASISFRPFDRTTLSMSAGHAVIIPHYATETNKNTRWSASINQRFFSVLDVSVGTGYGKSSYRPITATASVPRDDVTRSYDIWVGTTLLQRLKLSLFYRHIKSTSSDSRLSFDSNQQGFEIGYQY